MKWKGTYSVHGEFLAFTLAMTEQVDKKKKIVHSTHAIVTV